MKELEVVARIDCGTHTAGHVLSVKYMDLLHAEGVSFYGYYIASERRHMIAIEEG